MIVKSLRLIRPAWTLSCLLMGWLACGLDALASEPVSLPALPESLGQWYKPQNKRQVWLHTMFSLRRELQAIEEYADEGDAGAVAKWGERFVKHLRSIPEMVPEWRDEIDWPPVARLEADLRAGNLPGVKHGIDRVRRDCRSCHREYRVLAALRYRSPDFSAVTLDDGQGGNLPFADHMERLSLILNRIRIASDDRHWNAAGEASQALRGELDRLSASCAGCHDDPAPRARILGADSQALLDSLDAALAQQDTRQAAMKLGEAAVDVCARCHATHRTLSEMKRLLFD